MGNQRSTVAKVHTSPVTGSKPALFTAANSHPMLKLQQMVGNRAVQRLIESEFKRSPLEDSNEAAGSGATVNALLNSPGKALEPATRTLMESSFGMDFSPVRIHTDAPAAESAAAIHAHAYTSGNDIVFGEGRYSPDTAEGQRLLAHELAHVVQQGSGPVAGTPTADGSLSISDPEDAFEKAADAQAEQVMEGGTSEAVQSAGERTTAASVQRQIDDLPPTLPSPQWEGPPVVDPVPDIPIVEPGPPGIPTPFPEPIPAGPVTLPSAGVEAAEGAAGLGAEAILPVALSGAAGVAAGVGMGELADSSLTKTGAFGTNADTGQNQSAMDWGAGWGTSVDKWLGNTEPSIAGGIAAGAGGIVGGIGGAGYGAYNWLKNQL